MNQHLTNYSLLDDHKLKRVCHNELSNHIHINLPNTQTLKELIVTMQDV